MEDQKIESVDVSRLRTLPVGHATVDGTRHVVLQPRGRVIQSVRTADKTNSTERLYAAVAQCVPTLGEDGVMDLTPNEVSAIWAIACGGIEAAHSMFPNVYGPADASSTSPA